MADRSELLATLREAASPLREVDEKKMFGCEALFTKGAIFALVWKTGRIGVKLPDEARFGALASQKGAEPWQAGPMVMSHWLLVPPAVERDVKKLAPWVEEAHAMAAAGMGATKKAKAPAKAKAKAPAKAKAKAKPKPKPPRRATQRSER
jgi:TfoX/Sxy family transcriptional regulator of competence genes